MDSLWLVLLDVSGSMGKGFADDDRDVLPGTAKLDVARRCLLAQIHRLPGRVVDTVRTHAALITFADEPELVSPPKRADDFDFDLSTLRPAGSTNLAAALDFAREVSQGLPGSDFSVDILLISDGLSNVGNENLERVVEKIRSETVARVDTILIRPLKPSIGIAKMVSVRGDFQEVSTADGLEMAVSDFGSSHLERADDAAARRYQLHLSLLAGAIAVLVAVTGLYTALVQRPLVAVPAASAAVLTLLGVYLIRAFLARGVSTILGPGGERLRTYRYPVRTRRLMLTLGLASICCSCLLLLAAGLGPGTR